ncbi:MAG: RagB/SusD family nutrient uptake outer membrane protein [Gemmatimonadetes bacterium]|nr:RagB/SusD family nutrient uptake outer membrane protein [Gemmatimonadota bacterium]
MNTQKMPGGISPVGRGALVLALLGLAACDFEVSNPGPVQDKALNDPAAFAALANGMGRDLSEAMNWVAYSGGAASREVHPGGTTENCGVTPNWQQGILDDVDTNTHWNNAQRARWTAEDGVRRMSETLGNQASSNRSVAQAYLWAGYANRFLGDNMCEAIFDGGPAQPNIKYFERAEAHFTKAIEVGRAAKVAAIEQAALAGRASVRVWLKNWSGAVADAAAVPKGFSYQLNYYNVGDLQQWNRVYYCSSPIDIYDAHTTWNTWVDEYYRTTKDPRTPYTVSGRLGKISILCCGRVPWNPQSKYNRLDAPIKLSNWREMELIKAEAKLVANDWPGGMAIMNAMRADVGVAPWTAASLEEAYTRLKRERAIELWLEARRLGDLRRWSENKTPGALDPLEVDPERAHIVANRSLCFPTPRSEKFTNPNLRK